MVLVVVFALFFALVPASFSKVLTPSEIENMQTEASLPIESIYDLCYLCSVLEGCNFDKNLCQWKNVRNSGSRYRNRNSKKEDIKEIDYNLDDVFDWKRQRGRTPSSGTGPSRDHSGGGKNVDGNRTEL